MDYPVIGILIFAAICLVLMTFLASGFVRFGFPIPSPSRRVGRIDGLRGYLAAFVMIHHFVFWYQVTQMGRNWDPPSVNAFNNFGTGGVALFFMITGLLFYTRVLKGFSQVDWRATYISRVFRIYPLLIVSVLTVFTIILVRRWPAIAFDWSDASAAIKWLSTVSEPSIFGYSDAFRINFNVLWSLWYEWVFYLIILPALALLSQFVGKRFPSWYLPAAGVISCVVIRHWFSNNILQFLPLFFAGMLAFEVRRHEPLAGLFRSNAASALAIFSLAAGVTFLRNPYGVFQIAVLGLFFTCIVCDNDFWGVFSTRGAQVLGEASFGIYLFHGIVLDLIFVNILPVLGNDPHKSVVLALLPISGIIVTIVAGALYCAIERTFIKLGKGLVSRES